MADNNKMMRRFLKKGLVICVAGVMAFSTVACSGGKDKKADSPKSKTESMQSTDKRGSTKKKSSLTTEKKKETPEVKDNKKETTAARDNKTAGGAQNSSPTGTAEKQTETKQDRMNSGTESDNRAGAQGSNKNNSTTNKKTN